MVLWCAQELIEHPMDLCHVSNKLNHDGYESPEAFAADVELTFANALQYEDGAHIGFVLSRLPLGQGLTCCDDVF